MAQDWTDILAFGILGINESDSMICSTSRVGEAGLIFIQQKRWYLSSLQLCVLHLLEGHGTFKNWYRSYSWTGPRWTKT